MEHFPDLSLFRRTFSIPFDDSTSEEGDQMEEKDSFFGTWTPRWFQGFTETSRPRNLPPEADLTPLTAFSLF